MVITARAYMYVNDVISAVVSAITAAIAPVPSPQQAPQPTSSSSHITEHVVGFLLYEYVLQLNAIQNGKSFTASWRGFSHF